MLETLTAFFMRYSEMVGHNPLLAALLLPVIPTIAYVCRAVPKHLWEFFVTHATTSMEMNNAGWNGNEDQYNAFMRWFMQSPWATWSRQLYVGGGYNYDSHRREVVVGPGKGTHFFFWKGRLFWFKKAGLESGGSDKQKEEITLTTVGRKHRPILELIDAFKYEEKEDKIGIYAFGKDGWTRVANIVKRPIETVCVAKSIKDDIHAKLDRFIKNPDWFRSRGIPYKLTFLFHGKHGTGKTTLIKAIAGRYNRNLMVLDLSLMTNVALANAMATLPDNSMLLIEDIDASTEAVFSRTRSSLLPPQLTDDERKLLPDVQPGGVTQLLEAAPASPTSNEFSNNEGPMGLTLSGILNSLDGVVSLDDVIVCITTNHLERLDAALIRKGRVDYTHHIGDMTDAEIRDYIAVMYGVTQVPDDIVFHSQPGSDVQSAYMDHPEDLTGFMEAVGYQSTHEPLKEAS